MNLLRPALSSRNASGGAVSGTVAPPTAQESLRALRRGQVLAEARRIIAEEGLEGLTFAALEKRLSFTRGVITYHFHNKDEVVLQVLEGVTREIRERTRALVAQTPRGSARVAAVVEGMVRGFLENPEAPRILLSFWSRIHSDPRIAELNAALYDGFRKETERLLRQEQKAGMLPEGVAHKALAALVVGTVLGLVSQAFFQPKAFDLDAALLEAQALFASHLDHGVARGKTPRSAI